MNLWKYHLRFTCRHGIIMSACKAGRRVGMADEADSKSVVGNHVWVQVPPPAVSNPAFSEDAGSFFLTLQGSRCDSCASHLLPVCGYRFPDFLLIMTLSIFFYRSENSQRWRNNLLASPRAESSQSFRPLSAVPLPISISRYSYTPSQSRGLRCHG